MSIVRSYQKAFHERSGELAFESTAASVDWTQAPLKHSFLEGRAQVPLPSGARLLEARPNQLPGSVTRLDVARLCWFANGLLRRKFDLDWNRSALELMKLAPNYGRGAASGGGLYPVELYWVAQGVPNLCDGVYHYCEARSSLVRIRMGGYGSYLRLAWDGGHGRGSVFLLLSVRYWKNVFKYRDLGYQIFTEDCGAMLAALEVVAESLGLQFTVGFQFADSMLGSLLGLNPDDEVIMGIAEVGLAPGAGSPDPQPRRRQLARLGETRRRERSKRVTIPSLIRAVHRATVSEDRSSRRVEASSWCGAPAASTCIALPHLTAPRSPSLLSLLRRSSSMGRQSAAAPIPLGATGAILRAMTRSYKADIYDRPSPPRVVRTFLIAQQVADLRPGGYAYDDTMNCLEPVSAPTESIDRVQDLYYLSNYNLHQTCLILILVAKQKRAYDVWGDRSIRICNMEAGFLAQRACMAAAEMNLACGAALGFNSAQLDDRLHLDRSVEAPVLCLFVSHKPNSAAGFASDFF